MMKPVFPVVLALAAWAGSCQAGSVDWGTSFNDALYDAAGSPLTADFKFELGTFPVGFSPTTANLGQWASQWKLIEPAALNMDFQYVAENSLLTTDGPYLRWERDASFDEEAPLENTNLFEPGESVFVWVFNQKSITALTQWGLVTGKAGAAGTDTGWQLTAAMGAELAPTLSWRLSNADEAVVGGLHGTQGPGGYSANPGSFTLQTALVSAIPEPGAATLLLTAAASLAGARRRRREGE